MPRIEESIDKYDNNELTMIIDRCVRGEKAREILKRRMIDKIKFEPLAEEFGLSVTHIKTIVYKSQEQLLKRI